MTDELPGAGPELDEMVAEVLGWTGEHIKLAAWHEAWSSGDDRALAALEKWRKEHPDWTGSIDFPGASVNSGYSCWLWPRRAITDIAPAGAIGQGPTLAVAICHAIVLAGRAVQG